MQAVIIDRSYLLPHNYNQGTIVEIFGTHADTFLAMYVYGREQIVLLCDIALMMPCTPS